MDKSSLMVMNPDEINTLIENILEMVEKTFPNPDMIQMIDVLIFMISTLSTLTLKVKNHNNPDEFANNVGKLVTAGILKMIEQDNI